MKKQEARQKGIEAGERLYHERPNLTYIAILSWAGTEAARRLIPLKRYGDYQQGCIDRYNELKQKEQAG